MLPFLTHPLPGVRGAAALLLGNLKAGAAREALETLLKDGAVIDIYRNGAMEKKAVAQLAMESLSKI